MKFGLRHDRYETQVEGGFLPQLNQDFLAVHDVVAACSTRAGGARRAARRKEKAAARMAPEKEPEDPDNFEFQKFLFDMTMRREAHERVLEDAERSLCDELRKALLDLSPNEYAVAVLNVVDVSHPLPDPPFPLDDEDLSGCPGWDDDPAGDAFEDHHSLRKAIASYGHMLHEVRAELIQARLDEGRNAADAGAAAPDVLDETAFQKALEGDPALETQQRLVREIQSKTEELDGRRPARRLSP